MSFDSWTRSLVLLVPRHLLYGVGSCSGTSYLIWTLWNGAGVDVDDAVDDVAGGVGFDWMTWSADATRCE